MGTTYHVGGPTRFAHQQRGLHKLITTGGVTALLFDPGLGKTAVVIDYAGLLALKSPTGEARVLVVCPLAAVDTWVDQTAQFASPMISWWAEVVGGSIPQRAEALASRGGQPWRGTVGKGAKHHPRALHHSLSLAFATGFAHGTQRTRPVTASEGPDALPTPRVVIVVTNIDTLASRQPKGSQRLSDRLVEAIRRFGPDLVVVDESHKIKGATANASRVLARVAKFCRRRAILTGTVMPSGPLDVFAQWRFLAPYAFGDTRADGSRTEATEGGFRERYAVLGGWMGKEVIGYRNLDHLQQIMAANSVVARKDEALDLPPTTDVVIPVRLSAAEKRAYGEMKKQLQTMLADGSLAKSKTRLSQAMRLRQITSGHVPDENGVVKVVGRAKVDTIASLVNDTLAGEKRVVVFCYFSREVAMLSDALDVAGTEVLRIEGDTPTDERMLMRKRFGTDPDPDDSNEPGRLVMVAQVGTMSLAVNELVTASHAVFGSLSLQRDDLEQAKARLDRQGQTRPVTFWYAIARNTVDAVILKSHQERTDLEDAVLAHIRGTALSPADPERGSNNESDED